MSKLQTNAIRHLGSSTDNMTFDSAGRVFVPNNPHARVSKNNGNVTGPAVVVFNFADEDLAGLYNSSTGRFTAPATGKYLSCHGLFSQNGSSAWVKWRVNGSIIATTYTNTTTYNSVAGSIVLKMNAGDYLDIYVETGGYAIYGNDRSQCWATFTLLS